MLFPRSLVSACPLAGDLSERGDRLGEGSFGWAQLCHPAAVSPIQGPSRLCLLFAFVCFVFEDVMLENLNTWRKSQWFLEAMSEGELPALGSGSRGSVLGD